QRGRASTWQRVDRPTPRLTRYPLISARSLPSSQLHSSDGAESNYNRTPDSRMGCGSATTKHEWYELIPRYLDQQDSSFRRTLYEYGYTLERGKVHTSTEEHAYQLGISNLKRGTFLAPNPLSGISLLLQLSLEARNASADLGTCAAKELVKHVSIGLSEPSTVSFDRFRQTHELYNNQLPLVRRNADAVIAETYAATVRDLGEHIATRLDLKMDSQSASGDLNKTVNIALSVLAKIEITQSARTLKLIIPANGDRVWMPGRD
ncbi:MAG: hypothetical protein SGPRY_015021, partial [Prymnesium sp.]